VKDKEMTATATGFAPEVSTSNAGMASNAELLNMQLSELQAAAYVRARNADPMCSFGDFVAISHEVDMVKVQAARSCGCWCLLVTVPAQATAMILKIEVSDGIIART